MLTAAAAATVLALSVSACGSDGGTPDVETRVPATPVAGPADPPAPAGDVVAQTAGVISLSTAPAGGQSRLLVQSEQPAELEVRSGHDPAEAPRTVPLPDSSAPLALVGSPDAPAAVVPAPGGVVRVDLSSGDTTRADLDGGAISAIGLPGGGFAIGTADGVVHILGADMQTQRTIDGFVSVDSLAAADGKLLVLDSHQTSLTEVDPDTGDTGAALRVGKGATRIVADSYGRVIAIDTDGGQILVYTLDPLLNRQTAPIGDSPSALVEDPDRGLVWVTFTGTDEVAAFDLSSGAPVEKYRFPTVAFPTSVTLGPDGAVYVGSGADGGVARIAPEQIR